MAINHLQREALTNDKHAPRYGYLAPLRNQAKAIAWDYLKYYSHPIPGVVTFENELRVDYPNGGRVQLFGCDNPDALRGVYFDGVVLDEYAQMPGRLFGTVIRPALSDRSGWACFLGTPNGKNAFYDLYLEHRDDPEWLVRVFRASETGLLSAEELADARKLLGEDEYAQEYECSWAAAVYGSYYAKLLGDAERDGRITKVPLDPALPVHTAWDLGMDDAMSIWFIQQHGPQVRLVDYVENFGLGIGYYAKILQDKKYVYGNHYAPGDIKVREIGTGITRMGVAAELGIKFTVASDVGVADGIHAVRNLIPNMWIDKDRCKEGLDSLINYRQVWDDKRGVFRGTPLHDWASHGADALRYFAVSHNITRNAWKPLNYPKVQWV
jgi:phage terminase large subunit